MLQCAHMAEEMIHYTVRIPRGIKDLMRDNAAHSGRSLNGLFVWVMKNYLEGKLIPAETLLKDAATRRFVKEVIKESKKQIKESKKQ